MTSVVSWRQQSDWSRESSAGSETENAASAVTAAKAVTAVTDETEETEGIELTEVTEARQATLNWQAIRRCFVWPFQYSPARRVLQPC